MSTIQNSDHSYGSPSLAWEELQTLCDIIAGKIVELDSDILAQRQTLERQEAEIQKWRSMLTAVQRQVEAGKLSVEAAVQALNGQRNAIPELVSALGRAS